jgi:hypothetical protein
MTGNVVFQLDVVNDTMTPGVEEITRAQSPGRVSAAIAPAAAQCIKDNYQRQPPNKMGFPSTGFWADAVRATRWEILPDGVLVITDKLGVRQRYFGGIISAGKGISSATGQSTKYIIASVASPEAYGKLPSEISGLKFVRFGRGQDAPAALVAVRATATEISPKKRGQGFNPTAQQIGLVVLYWLKRSVTQKPNPNVLPTADEMGRVMGEALMTAFPA